MLLKARLRYGKISYQNGDVLERKDRWQPSERQEAHLMQLYKSTPEVIVQFFINANGAETYQPVQVKPASGWCTWLCSCLLACFLGLPITVWWFYGGGFVAGLGAKKK